MQFEAQWLVETINGFEYHVDPALRNKPKVLLKISLLFAYTRLLMKISLQTFRELSPTHQNKKKENEENYLKIHVFI